MSCPNCVSAREAAMSSTVWGGIRWDCMACGFKWLDESFAQVGLEGL